MHWLEKLAKRYMSDDVKLLYAEVRKFDGDNLPYELREHVARFLRDRHGALWERDMLRYALACSDRCAMHSYAIQQVTQGWRAQAIAKEASEHNYIKGISNDTFGGIIKQYNQKHGGQTKGGHSP